MNGEEEEKKKDVEEGGQEEWQELRREGSVKL